MLLPLGLGLLVLLRAAVDGEPEGAAAGRLGEWIAADWSLDALPPDDEREEATARPAASSVFVVQPAVADDFTALLAENVLSEWQGRRLPDFSLRVLQLNVTLPTFRLEVDVASPKETAATNRAFHPPAHLLHAVGTGGSALIRAAYKSTYRTTRRGQVVVEIRGFRIDLRFRFHRSQSRRLQLVPLSCTAKVAQMDVTLSPFLLDDTSVCEKAAAFAEQADEQLQLRGIPSPFDFELQEIGRQ
ncbi:hypothetical protein M3Y99_00208300 [Aphelenchoides fujianensis]|nr:hypothetical protein M3Y99_00208300 [Aphelenchoides fujianensis]